MLGSAKSARSHRDGAAFGVLRRCPNAERFPTHPRTDALHYPTMALPHTSPYLRIEY